MKITSKYYNLRLIKIGIILMVFQISSCSFFKKEGLVLGKWDLITDNDSIKVTLEFTKLEYYFRVSPSASNSSNGKWWIDNSKLCLAYRWIGGKDTLHLGIIKLTNNKLILYNPRAKILQDEKNDTLIFIKKHL